jgi:two-component system, NarL family, invasion response regulator UvrY
MIDVFIADDHAMFREGLKQILARQADMRVAGEAGTAAELLDALRTVAAHVLVLDVSMPGRSGLDALADIRVLRPEIPVLVLSMHPENQYAVRAIRGGAAGYLTKESAASELITAIRKVATGGRYINEAVAGHLAEAVVRPIAAEPHAGLSNREFQVLRMLAAGRMLRDIATELSLSEKTITTYRTRILEKLGLHNNAELTRYALEHHLID